MPTVFIPTALRPLAGGRQTLEVPGATVREVVSHLTPELRAELLDGPKLKPNLAVAVDGVVAPLGLLERVDPDSEIHFVAAIAGGTREKRHPWPVARRAAPRVGGTGAPLVAPR